MLHLQNENTELIRQLCETRTANNQLKHKSPSADGEFSSRGFKGGKPIRFASEGDQLVPMIDNLGIKKSESLYEPFAAMWNLIRLDPSVVQGKVSARTLLENLSRLAETGPLKSNDQSCPSPMLADDEDSSSSTGK